jgi:hypothetical protein
MLWQETCPDPQNSLKALLHRAGGDALPLQAAGQLREKFVVHFQIPFHF